MVVSDLLMALIENVEGIVESCKRGGKKMEAYKIQITAVAVVSILLINYFRSKRLPLMSTRIFSVFMVVSAVNLVFDIATVYTINHIETVSPAVNRFCHQMFIGSLDIMAYLLFLYVNNLAHKQERLPIGKLVLLSLPLAATLCVVAVAPLYYNLDTSVRYSYGPMAYTVYLSVAGYLLCVATNLFTAKDAIKKEKKNLIAAGMIVWGTIAVIQMLIPTLLISSLANLMMVLMVYLSFENPKEHADSETGSLNRMAFHRMISEMYAGKKKFYTVDYVLDDVEYIQDVYGYSGVKSVLYLLNQKIRTVTSARTFHSRSHVLSVVTTSTRVVEVLKNDLQECVLEWKHENGPEYKPKYHVDIIECPTNAASADKLYELIDYLNEVSKEREGINEVSQETVLEYQRFGAIQDLVENAIHHDGLEVVYQPIYSNETHSFASAEALVRLKDTQTIGFVSPEIFIPIAERKGLIKELGIIVFDKVCDFIKESKISELGVEYIEVNLSRVQGADTNLVDTLTACMKKHGVSPHSINLEITETAAIDAGNVVINNMYQLRQCGCHFSMDDFGTGYSNLSQIAKIKYELIKLDKSLIWPCFEEKGEEARIILRNCVKMLLELGVKIVAEGVETKEQADMLTNLGATYLQGYYFSRPIKADEYLAFLKEKQQAN